MTNKAVSLNTRSGSCIIKFPNPLSIIILFTAIAIAEPAANVILILVNSSNLLGLNIFDKVMKIRTPTITVAST